MLGSEVLLLFREALVFQDLFDAESVKWVLLQDHENEVLHFDGDALPERLLKGNFLSHYVLGRLVHILPNEWNVACDHCVENYTHTPDVILSIVALSRYYFW